MLSKLERLKSRLTEKSEKGSINTTIYALAKELHCLPDLLGREFEVVYEGNKIVKIIQKPIKIPTFTALIKELEDDYKRQEKAMKQSKRRGRR